MPFILFHLADCFLDCFFCAGVCVGDVGVGVGEELCGLAGVDVEARVWVIPAVGVGGHGCGGVVGGCEGALAVPAVAGAVVAPEGVVDGQHGAPEG